MGTLYRHYSGEMGQEMGQDGTGEGVHTDATDGMYEKKQLVSMEWNRICT